ncbi:hypothetical protein BIFGAL_04452 [Bifidobacterium gallicum DSM 20093 = LMG 11596]|uniref:Uncharacterized protein n=1 Tax=Bifidobacterium gallicum DSM 20093 = LMG 11596 TaxID=561180 RepID=D1NX45_9BIFI|nr:hypothetical protein BIFGAL_04452 [Bifidobacterium gallicum DSM 20093 = LMG 11596]
MFLEACMIRKQALGGPPPASWRSTLGVKKIRFRTRLGTRSGTRCTAHDLQGADPTLVCPTIDGEKRVKSPSVTWPQTPHNVFATHCESFPPLFTAPSAASVRIPAHYTHYLATPLQLAQPPLGLQQTPTPTLPHPHHHPHHSTTRPSLRALQPIPQTQTLPNFLPPHQAKPHFPTPKPHLPLPARSGKLHFPPQNRISADQRGQERHASPLKTTPPLTSVVRETHLQRKTHIPARPPGRKPDGGGIDRNRDEVTPLGKQRASSQTRISSYQADQEKRTFRPKTAAPLTSPVRKTTLPHLKRISADQRGQERHASPLQNRIPSDQPNQGRHISVFQTASPLTNPVRKTALSSTKLHLR